MYTIFDIANWFLAKDVDINNKKLNKLAYYAYCWYLALMNETVEGDEFGDVCRFFDNSFQAQIHGAVSPVLFDAYREYQANPIPQYQGRLVAFSPDEKDVLQQVWNVYGSYTGDELENICCQEPPWLKARKGLGRWDAGYTIISDKDIFECYASRLSG